MANKDGRMSGNKGEWSELYAFMKLLSQGEYMRQMRRLKKLMKYISDSEDYERRNKR